jgi:hypothetical protein
MTATRTHYWFLGAIVGLLIPTFLFGLFALSSAMHVGLGENPLTAVLVIALGFMEIPAVMIARTLNLPIETGGVAFLVFNLNAFGSFCVAMFWGIVGAVVGFVVDRV